MLYVWMICLVPVVTGVAVALITWWSYKTTLIIGAVTWAGSSAAITLGMILGNPVLFYGPVVLLPFAITVTVIGALRVPRPSGTGRTATEHVRAPGF